MKEVQWDGVEVQWDGVDMQVNDVVADIFL